MDILSVQVREVLTSVSLQIEANLIRLTCLCEPDVVQKFIDSKGGFPEVLKYDVGGMMGLYQAAQFRMEGEEILDQASTFTRSNLVGVLPHWNQNQASVEPIARFYPMKLFLNALYDVADEFSYKILQKHGWNPKPTLKRAWILLCKAFLVEAKWFSSGQLPTSEEYLKNGVISSGVHVVFVHIFFLLGDDMSKESVDLIEKVPGLVSHVATILRLWDDLGSAKNENQNGYDGSYIECYLKENKEATLESAREHVTNMISGTWKKLNKEYLKPTILPLSFKKASMNAAKMVSSMYNYDANQQLPSLENQIKSLLYEGIPLQ